MRITGTLENWMVDPVYPIVWGNIYGDIRGRFPDGQWIHTSRIRYLAQNMDNKMDMQFKDGDVITTLHSLYKLGKKKKEC